MRSPYKVNSSDPTLEIYLASPHQFFLDYQQQLGINWVPVSYLVLFLQRSQISLQESNKRVIAEKDRLRTKFLRMGCNLIFSLCDREYPSDLFDPRTGYPLLSQPGELTFDDSAAIATLLDYPLFSYQNCTLIKHPTWGYSVYPATVVTSATLEVLKSVISY